MRFGASMQPVVVGKARVGQHHCHIGFPELSHVTVTMTSAAPQEEAPR